MVAVALMLVVGLVGLVVGAADDPGLETIRADALKGHVYFLASPEMGGRDSLSLQGLIAGQYLAGFFHRLGVKPIGDRKTFFQNFPMVEAHLDQANTYLRARLVGTGGQSVVREYTPGTDFTMPRGSVDVRVEAQLVFAGYGASAPEYNYDDFKGIDVAGKVVMVLTHEPQENDPQSRFMGRFQTIHAYNLWKLQVIQRFRAAAVLMVQEASSHRLPRATSGPTNGQVMANHPLHRLTSPYGDVPVFTITRRLADELLAPAGKTIDQLQAEIDLTGQPHSMAIDGVTIDLRQAIKERRVVQTRNVVGLIEGSDPTLKDEYVVVTAHHDHVGQKDEFIYHGADDNASGCAAVVAIAEAFQASRVPPKRSILFLVFEAEEDGLLGAVHYVNNPLVPLEKTVGVLNMDMIGRDEESETWNIKAEDSRNRLNVVGTLYSPELRKVIEAENRAIGLMLDYKTDGDDRQNWFSRSDHFPFATKRVPMVLFNTGEHPDYHTTNDTWDRINYPKMEKIVRLVYLSAKNLANSPTRPRFVTQQTAGTSSASGR